MWITQFWHYLSAGLPWVIPQAWYEYRSNMYHSLPLWKEICKFMKCYHLSSLTPFSLNQVPIWTDLWQSHLTQTRNFQTSAEERAKDVWFRPSGYQRKTPRRRRDYQRRWLPVTGSFGGMFAWAHSLPAPGVWIVWGGKALGADRG